MPARIASVLLVAVLGCVGSALASASAPAPAPASAGDLSRGGVFRRRITTSDGVPLALYRYTPPGGGQRFRPVLLVPDLGLGRHVFDAGGFGLAPWLSAAGREVFVLELRGHGASGVPLRWSLQDVVRRDLPAALAAIRRVRPGPVDLVVHGYSGTLALAATTRELRGQVGRVVALSTPALAEVPNPHAQRVLERGGRLSSLSFDPQGARVLELLFARHARIPRARYGGLLSLGLFDLGGEAAGELLGWMRSGDLALGDGSSVRGRLAEYDRPTLQLLALRNNWVHPEAASPLREVATAAKISVRLLSILQFHREDYTHLSLLQGEGAAQDVFPAVGAFLAEGGQR